MIAHVQQGPVYDLPLMRQGKAGLPATPSKIIHSPVDLFILHRPK
jgi:hypothetical protein